MRILVLLALMVPYVRTGNDLKSCFSNLSKFDIKAKQISYDKIVGTYYGQAYCRIAIDEEHPYSCVRLTLHPMKNPLFGRFTLSIRLNGENKTTEFNYKVFPTLLPGVFLIAKDNNLKKARVLVVLEKNFDVFNYYLCSTDDASPSTHYNDFRINTLIRDVNPGQMLTDLRCYQMTTTCNSFIIPQFNCF